MTSEPPAGKQVRDLHISRDRTLLGSRRVVATFRLADPGTDHTVEFERFDQMLRTSVVVRLDGRPVYQRSGLGSMLVGRQVVTFDVGGDEIGEIRFTGLGVGCVVVVRVAGTSVI